jgi:pimeloyl-ACP methyl ester carboxylesterase
MLTKVSGEGAPIVLVPGGVTGWSDWELHTKRLKAVRKVIRVQLLNVQYGLENRPLPPDYSVKMESRALAASINELHLDTRFDIAAWSFGALVALDYSLDNADNVRSLTLIEPPAWWVIRALGEANGQGAASASEYIRVVGRAMGKGDVVADHAAAMPDISREDVTEDTLEQFLYAVGICARGQSARSLSQWPVWVRHRQSLRGSFAPIEHHDDPERLRAFTRPVLLVKGAESVPFLHWVIDILAAQLPRSRVIEMPRGHAPQIVSIDNFLREMGAFQAEEEG